MTETNQKMNPIIENLYKAGAHFGLVRSRRHPTARIYTFGTKNKVEIFDLEKTHEALEKAKDFIRAEVAKGGQVLFVGGKNEAQAVIRSGAQKVEFPYVAGRWLGGSLTNYPEIKKRISRMEDLLSQKEKGELAKYTKKERLLIDREIIKLQGSFAGLAPMRSLPKVLFVIDAKKEEIAVKEAHKLHIPVVSLMNSDCNMRDVEFAIPGNDAAQASIKFFVDEIVSAIVEGKKLQLTPKEPQVHA